MYPCLLADLYSWKETIEQRLRELEETVAILRGNSASNGVPQPQQTQMYAIPQPAERATSEEADQRPPEAWQVVADAEDGSNAAPAAYVSAVANEPPSPISSNSRSKSEADFITRGLITLDNAERLFRFYHQRHDHFLYSIIGDHSTLSSVRRESTTLASAICTVAALHSQSDDYHTMHREYRRRVSNQFFSRQHSFDEVRGLCIGAFWLSDMSWALVGAAVRIAIEINLHRCFHTPDLFSKDWYTQARVYLLVYVCDHHSSIIYGRPPMTRELDMDQARTLLSSQYAGDDDKRLFAQSLLWSHNYQTYKIFGSDSEAPLTDASLADFQRLSTALDSWRADWESKLPASAHVGNYPAKGVALHTNFGKLYLCSQAFRPFSTAVPVSMATRSGVEDFKLMAINSATSILQAIVMDQEIQSYLNGLPAYFDTMIAFAVVFLLKLVSNDTQNINIDRSGILFLLDQISVVLTNIAASMRPQHLLSGISASIQKLITKACQPGQQQAASEPYVPPSIDLTAPSDMQLDNTVSNWMLSPDDAMFLGNFDFMGNAQDIDFNFMDFDTFPTTA